MNVVPLSPTPRGLVLLAPERAVTVTGEERHQDVLAGRSGRVVVALVPCTIRAGKHAGRRGVEVQLDGRRVGELTGLMSERYLPVMDGVAARGGRPGCEALLKPDHRGVQVELRLPAVDTRTRPGPDRPTAVLGHAPHPFGGGPVVPAPRPAPTTVVPMPAFPPADRPRRGGRRVLGAAAAVLVVLALAGTLGNGSKPDDPPATTVTTQAAQAAPAVPPTTTTAADAADTAPTADAAPTTRARAAAPTTRTTTPRPRAAAPAPTTRVDAEPVPRARTTTATTTRAPKPPPEAAAPASGCDPNYSGCVPIASDVDCEGGSGNGPAYVRGPVRVLGTDVYGLDNDHDGVGCE